MLRDSVGGTFLVATVLCIVCSVLVSSAAVGLRPLQEANKELDRQKNILIAAGLTDETASRQEINELSKQVEPVLVDLETGEPVDPAEVGINPETYDPREAARKPDLSSPVEPEGSLPGISRREKYDYVYEVKKDGQLTTVVLPIYGKGLWSTLYGFLALDSDLRTIQGITFYEQKETPGLGGEVDNKKWKAQWHGKQAFDQQGDVEIRVIKGVVGSDNPQSDHMVDGLSGATITTRGVSDLVRYWLGPDGFGPFLDNVKKKATASTESETSDGKSQT